MIRSFCRFGRVSGAFPKGRKLLLSNINHFSVASLKMSEANPTCETPKCIFCDIINENDPSKILYRDEVVVVFTDIKPAAKCHYLIVAKEHIKDVKVLRPDQKSIVEHMMETGKKMLSENSENPSDARFGFHWPPFHSVSHLHMHAISPANENSFLNKMIFRPDSWWFVSPEYVLKRLEGQM